LYTRHSPLVVRLRPREDARGRPFGVLRLLHDSERLQLPALRSGRPHASARRNARILFHLRNALQFAPVHARSELLHHSAHRNLNPGLAGSYGSGLLRSLQRRRVLSSNGHGPDSGFAGRPAHVPHSFPGVAVNVTPTTPDFTITVSPTSHCRAEAR